jgi:hypothetical protein
VSVSLSLSNMCECRWRLELKHGRDLHSGSGCCRVFVGMSINNHFAFYFARSRPGKCLSGASNSGKI